MSARSYLQIVLFSVVFSATFWSKSPVLSQSLHTPLSYPLAVAHPDGSMLAVGDRKGLWVEPNGRLVGFSHPKTLALGSLPAQWSISGGLGRRGPALEDRLIGDANSGIYCLGPHAVLLSRIALASGRSRVQAEMLKVGRVDDLRRRLRCSMSPSGLVAIYEMGGEHSATLWLQSERAGPWQAVPAPKLTSAHLLHAGEAIGFVLVGKQGLWVWKPGEDGWAGGLRLQGFDEWTMPSVSSGGVMWANGYTTRFSPWFAVFAAEQGERSVINGETPTFVRSISLPPRPCEDQSRCGLTLLDDGRWLLAGHWGMFYGRIEGIEHARGDNDLSKLKVRSMRVPGIHMPYRGGIAMSFAEKSRRIVLLGGDVEDILMLPKGLDEELDRKPALFSAAVNDSSAGERYAVWLKPNHQNLKRIGNTSSTAVPMTDLMTDLTTDPLLQKATPGFHVLFTQKRAANRSRTHAEGADQRLVVGWVESDQELLKLSNRVLFFEREVRYHIQEARFAGGLDLRAKASPWWMEAVGRDRYLSYAELQVDRTLPPALVGVIDTGIDAAHPQLVDGLWQNPGEAAFGLNGIDDDQNGWVDDIYGVDVVEEDSQPQDDSGHGTHVSGLIVADDLGLATHTRVLMAKAFDAQGSGGSIDIARAMIYAAEAGVDVINGSWGGGLSAQVLEDAFAEVQARGIAVVSSSGNAGLNLESSKVVPLIYPGVIGVGALKAGMQLAAFSNYGASEVDFLFPGEAILSTLPEGMQGEMSGTSMAAPLFSAVLATEMVIDRGGRIGNLGDVGNDLDGKQNRVTDIFERLCQSAERLPPKRGAVEYARCGVWRMRSPLIANDDDRDHD